MTRSEVDEERMYEALCDLASLDTHDTDLRDHPEAYKILGRLLASRADRASAAPTEGGLKGVVVSTINVDGLLFKAYEEGYAHAKADYGPDSRVLVTRDSRFPVAEDEKAALERVIEAEVQKRLAARAAPTEGVEPVACGQVNSGVACDLPRVGDERRCPDCNPRSAAPTRPAAPDAVEALRELPPLNNQALDRLAYDFKIESPDGVSHRGFARAVLQQLGEKG